MTGFDSSPAMVELAERRLGEDATLLVADLSVPLPFADGLFDDVVVSLVLHYLEDWTAPLAELRRVLRPGGRLLLSVNHPIVYTALNPGSDCFALARWSAEYTFDGHSTRADLLAPAVARDDRCVHRRGLPPLGHQRTPHLSRDSARAPASTSRGPHVRRLDGRMAVLTLAVTAGALLLIVLAALVPAILIRRLPTATLLTEQ